MLLYFAISLLILSLILFFYNWNENKIAIYLGGFLTLIALYSVTYYFTAIAKDPFWFAILYANFTFLNLAAGPLLYFYVRGIIRDSAKLHSKDALHFIPLGLNLVGLLPHILSPFSEKLAIANVILADFDSIISVQIDWLVPIEVNYTMRPLLLLSYSCYSMYLLYNFKKRQISHLESYQYRITFQWLFALLTITIISTACYLYFVIGFFNDKLDLALLKLNWATYTITFTLFCLTIFLLFFPQILYGLPHFISEQEDSSTNYEFSLDKNLEEKFRELAEAIKHYMDIEKPYLKSEFSLEDLAEALDAPRHHISYCFRFIFMKGFTKIRSEYRISYAKRLIENPENDHLSYEGIGQESGFNTRSRFYAAFQEIEGCSPGEYRAKRLSL